MEARLQQSPKQTVAGVVDADGVSLISFGPDAPWRTVLHAIVWRIDASEIRTEPLRIEFPERVEIEGRLQPNSCFVATGGIAENADGEPVMLASSLRECPDIPDLKDAAEHALRPETIDHPVLGKAKYDPKYRWYTGSLKAKRLRARVMVDANNRTISDAANRTIAMVASDLRSFIDRAFDFAADDSLDLYNKTWREPHQRVLTREKFIRALKTPNLHVHADGCFTLDIECGNLFLGHAIEVRGTGDVTFTECGLAG